MHLKPCRIEVEPFRRLTKDEIDRRIEVVAADLLAPGDHEDCRPRWITAGELVRRMRPFIVLN